MSRVAFFLLVLVLVGVAPSCASAARTPHGAALVMRDCLRAHRWSARLTDGGTVVRASTPRVRRNVIPARPSYAVAFYDLGGGLRVGPEVTVGLNAAELRVAHACRAKAMR